MSRFNNTASAADVESLRETLNDRMHESCEVNEPIDYLDDIETHEQDNDITFTAKQLTQAYRQAAEDFVDSAVANAREHTTDRTPEEIERSVLHYEVMRPSARRRAELKKILTK